MNKLPDELIEEIFSYLNFTDGILLSRILTPSKHSLRNTTLLIGNNCLLSNLKQHIPITQSNVTRLKSQLNYATRLSTASFSNLTASEARILLPQCRNLKQLLLSGNKEVTDESIRLLLSNTSQLSHIDISYCRGLTGSSISLISQVCKSLVYLDISHTATNTKSWLNLLATLPSTVNTLKAAKCYSIDFSIISLPSTLSHIDISGNITVTLSVLMRTVQGRRGSVGPLRLDVRDCECLVGDDVESLEQYAPTIIILSNPRLRNETPDGIREYITSLAAY